MRRNRSHCLNLFRSFQRTRPRTPSPRLPQASTARTDNDGSSSPYAGAEGCSSVRTGRAVGVDFAIEGNARRLERVKRKRTLIRPYAYDAFLAQQGGPPIRPNTDESLFRSES